MHCRHFVDTTVPMLFESFHIVSLFFPDRQWQVLALDAIHLLLLLVLRYALDHASSNQRPSGVFRGGFQLASNISEKFLLLLRLHRLQGCRSSSNMPVENLVHIPALPTLPGVAVKVHYSASTLAARNLLRTRGSSLIILCLHHLGISHDYSSARMKTRFHCGGALCQKSPVEFMATSGHSGHKPIFEGPQALDMG